jgi:alpha-galactosidase
LRIVLVGAGSRSFGLKQVMDVLRSAELRGRGVTLALVDENAQALETMSRVAARAKQAAGTDVALESHTDRKTALPGADYVVVSVARRRMDLWEQDYRVPLAHGFRHILGENGGPGALFHGLRSIHLVVPLCRDVETLCPRARVLNFTNPEARVLHAVKHLTKADAYGFCHGVFSALERLPAYTGRALEDLEYVSAGLNHFYAFQKIRDRRTGEDLLPLVLARAAADTSGHGGPLFRKFAEVFGMFTYPSDDHIGEYVSFGAEFRKSIYKYGNEHVRYNDPGAAPRQDLLGDYAAGRIPADDPALFKTSEELTVPVICDIMLDRGTWRPSVNALNTEGYIPNMPRDVVVEVPVKADARGIHPQHVDPLPEPLASFTRTQYAIHGLLTEAYRTGSRKLLLQALLLDPCVDSIVAAEQLLDWMLDKQAAFLPTFA